MFLSILLEASANAHFGFAAIGAGRAARAGFASHATGVDLLVAIPEGVVLALGIRAARHEQQREGQSKEGAFRKHRGLDPVEE